MQKAPSMFFLVHKAAQFFQTLPKRLISLSGRATCLQTMNLGDNPIFQRVVSSEEVQVLSNVFTKYGHTLRFAGGPVRDILSGSEPKDLDFATTATPKEMKTMLEKEEIRMINAQGEKHGTITARINDKENYEVTTLRVDKVTDGRKAEVEFTLDWELDAGRRDLTVNSMFLDLDGILYDYYDGVNDLKHRRVRFVGSPVERIQEDYLRILRYFRFYGRISKSANTHEESTVNAIKENVQGVKILSGERIWKEWKKIILGNLGCELTLKMIEVGLTEVIGLPNEPNVKEFENVFHLSRRNAVILEPTAYLCALIDTSDEWLNLHQRLKFSKHERDVGLFIIENRNVPLGDENQNRSELWPLQCKIADTRDTFHTRYYAVELLKYKGLVHQSEQMVNWKIPKFPVNGNDLAEAGCPKGRYTGLALQVLKDIWKDRNFEVDKEELLKHLDEAFDIATVMAEKESSEKKKRKKK